MRIYYFLTVFIAGLLMVPAGAEMTDVKFNEKMADWKLYSRSPKHDLEFYYDTKNMMYPAVGSVIVTVKTVYKSEKAVNELKRMRRKNPLISADLKYDNIAYSIETLEIYCQKKEVAASEIMFDIDLDQKGNILNYVPNVLKPVPILPDSNREDLYKIVCPQG